MNKQDSINLKLRPALQECQLHQMRLHAAWEEAIDFPAIKDGTIQNLTETQIRTLDQLVFRFAKLHDAMGVRLLPAALHILQEWHDNEAFIDKLNRTEKLGLITSAEQWLLLRELRSQTAHECPEHPEIVLANLRNLVRHVPMLENAYTQLNSSASERLNG
jgi:hypothetical protein